MTTFKSRTNVLVSIITLWVLLFLLILALSEKIFTSGFYDLETRFAKESNQRVFNMLKSNLKYIYIINLDNAYWDDTYRFIQDRNKTYLNRVLNNEIFVDNLLNIILLYDIKGQLVWGGMHTFASKEVKPPPTNFANYISQHAKDLLTNRNKINNLISDQHGMASFIKIDNQVYYYALNKIVDSSSDKPANGYMFFAKILSKNFLKKLSKDIDYPINLISLEQFENSDKGKKILKKLARGPRHIHIDVIDENLLSSYRFIYNAYHEPIALLKVSHSRNVSIESQKLTNKNELALFIFSLIAIFTMSYLVFIFFRYQERLVNAFEKFVPKEFVKLLNKDEIINIALGDHVEKTITILFLDIRNFTTLSEKMSPEDNFNFINNVLAQTAPIINKHNGFIDKYIGDGVMALFTHPQTHAQDAIEAALLMNESLNTFNQSRLDAGQEEIAIGIGINTGPMMLGIIGTQDRIDGTVISDTVNTCARIQDATKELHHPVLIAESALKCLVDRTPFDMCYVTNLLPKGKTQKVAVYAVYPKESQSKRKSKNM